jgi:hypothetical protein
MFLGKQRQREPEGKYGGWVGKQVVGKTEGQRESEGASSSPRLL